MPDTRTRAALLGSSILLSGYVVTVLLLDHDVGRWHVSLAAVVVLSLVVGGLVAALLSRLVRGADPEQHLDAKLAAAQAVLLASLLAVDLSNARAPESYVARHPHRACIAAAFDEMSSLAREHGFEVTVVVAVAPSAVRVYSPHVEDLDAPLSDPHLITALLAHARDAGFATVNLLDAFAPYAAGDTRELLYFRDDDHWSPRGHAVVAGILAERTGGSLHTIGPSASGPIPAATRTEEQAAASPYFFSRPRAAAGTSPAA